MSEKQYTVYVGLTRDGLISKINAIKTWREIASCGLKDAKDFVEYVGEFEGGAHVQVILSTEALLRFYKILNFRPTQQEFVLSEVVEGIKPKWVFT
jgi:hypothetical protein